MRYLGVTECRLYESFMRFRLVRNESSDLHPSEKLDNPADLTSRFLPELVDLTDFMELVQSCRLGEDFVEQIGGPLEIMRLLFMSVERPELRGKWWRMMTMDVDELFEMMKIGVWPITLLDGILPAVQLFRPELYHLVTHAEFLFCFVGVRSRENFTKPVFLSWRDSNILEGSTLSMENVKIIDRDFSGRRCVHRLRFRNFQRSEYLGMIQALDADALVELAEHAGKGFRFFTVVVDSDKGEVEIIHQTNRLCCLIKKFARQNGDEDATMLARIGQSEHQNTVSYTRGKISGMSLNALRDRHRGWRCVPIPNDEPRVRVGPFAVMDMHVAKKFQEFSRELYVFLFFPLSLNSSLHVRLNRDHNFFDDAATVKSEDTAYGVCSRVCVSFFSSDWLWLR